MRPPRAGLKALTVISSILRESVSQPARVLSSASPRILRPKNMTAAHSLARPWAPIFLLTGAICRLAKPLLRNVERVEHVRKPRGKPDRGIHRRQADEDRGVETY